MPLEMHVFKVNEFVRLGTHGELDWNASREVLKKLVKAFVDGGERLALLDVRDSVSAMTDEQVIELVHVFVQGGVDSRHRLAVLHRPLPRPQSDIFALSAIMRGFDVGSFDDYERAVDWLSHPGGRDPDFDRDVYEGPRRTGTTEPPRAS